ncbi:Ketoreductase [Fusarium acuminatum]|jgi:NAD(P)-dependent dehydrogenase (short-subunit alcohol dehydrogenase family)|uniref:Ketoreductase n=1 Tax=Fusarium acuminatum TaxID=5515 RepID=A0ABZ2WNM2_9HYPO
MSSPVWFITAASGGFGHEIALLALNLGHTVIATARSTSRIQDLADAGAHTLAFDVTSPLSDLEAIAKDVYAKHGRVDYLINTAGYILDGAVEEVSQQELYDSFNTNVFGIFNTIKAFLPGMREQSIGENGKRGTVVTFGSIGSWRGGATYSVYSMVKTCVSSLAESLREEVEPFNIVATVVEPGYFRTGFLNAGSKVVSKNRMAVYDDESTPTGKTRRMLDVTDNNQPGDVKKGSKVIVEILTGTGVGKGRNVPVRIMLGSDADAYIRKKCEETLGLLDEWKEVVVSTDLEK